MLNRHKPKGWNKKQVRGIRNLETEREISQMKIIWYFSKAWRKWNRSYAEVWRIVFQAGGSASIKVLRLECAWCVQRIAQRPVWLGQSEREEQEQMKSEMGWVQLILQGLCGWKKELCFSFFERRRHERLLIRGLSDIIWFYALTG